MEKLAAETLPDGFSYEWTTLAFQQLRAGNTAVFAFVLAVVFVFLVLAAQFESLTLPVAVILIVPMCLIASIVGVVLRGQDNNILTQVGFIVLIGLAAKNAILIVEFAKQLEDQGRDRFAAAIEAARLRLRPILMTSLAFIFGVSPMVWAVGAGAELRQTLGTAVFSGMIGVTVFGLIFTPVFYVVTPLARRAHGAHAGAPRRTGGVTHDEGAVRVPRSGSDAQVIDLGYLIRPTRCSSSLLVGHVRLQPLCEGRGVGVVARALVQPLGEVDVARLLHAKRQPSTSLPITSAGVPAGANSPPKLVGATS